jgi:TonB family protein
LHIDKHGAVSQWRIARTSGHTVLDRSALEAARAIDRLRQADGLLNGESLNLSIPVRYRLVDS